MRGRVISRWSGWAGLAVLLASGLSGALAVRADTVTVGGGPARTSEYTDEPTLHPGAVAVGVQQVFDAQVTGQVYGSPLVDSGSLLVVTEANHVMWLDPATGAVKTDITLAEAPFDAFGELGCVDLKPVVGITSTPVIDPATHIAYVVAKGRLNGTLVVRIHAFDMVTRTERGGVFPVTFQGPADNDPAISFDPLLEHQRAGLLQTGGVVYASFGSHCDSTPYRGWVIGVDSATGAITSRWTDEADESSTILGAGIWMSGGGPASDATGQVLLATGNGDVPGAAVPSGSPVPARLGNAVVRLVAQPDRTLKATDFFMPHGAAKESAGDADLGSGGVTILPDSFGTPAHRHLAVVGGKSGILYLLDRDQLGGFAGPGGTDAVLQELGPYLPIFGKSAVWEGDGGWLYLNTVTQFGSAPDIPGGLLALQRTLSADGTTPQLALAGRSQAEWGWTSPAVVTSAGAASGSATVWEVVGDTINGENGHLLAFEPVPSAGTLRQVVDIPLSTSGQSMRKLSTPSVDGGRVYVTTYESAAVGNGHVRAYGVPTPGLTGAPVDLGAMKPDQSRTAAATFTASRSVTVTSIGLLNHAGVYVSDAGLSLGTPSPGLPAVLAAGDTLTLPVTLVPGTLGVHTGVIVATLTGPSQVGLSVTGTGVQTAGKLIAVPTTVDFGTHAFGSATTLSLALTNQGDLPVQVNAIGGLSDPISFAGAPPVLPFTVGGGSTATLSLTYTAPGVAEATSQTLTVADDGSEGGLSIPVSATAAPPGQLVATPANGADLGGVPLGRVATVTVTLANIGGVPVTINGSHAPSPATGFTLTGEPTTGALVAPGASISVTVVFRPAAIRSYSASWILATDDGLPQRVLTFTGRGIPTAAAAGAGYWLVASDGGVFPFGPAANGFGSTGGQRLNAPIVAMARTPSGRGYWLVASDGGVFPFGDAGGFGSTGGIRLNRPIVGMASTPSGQGYWLVAADGGIFPFGDAGGFGSTGGIRLNRPIVGMAATPSGQGYWLVASDGGIFPFGDAGGLGSTGAVRLNQPIVAMAATPSGQGYWLVASDGGIFPFGDAPGLGSTGGTRLNFPIVDMAATSSGQGYWLVAGDGGVFPFGDAAGLGSLGGVHLNQPVVAMAGAS